MVGSILLADEYRQAAELLAGGASWTTAAKEVGVCVEDLKACAADHRAEWQAVLKAARKRLLGEAGSEAMLMLRRLLRSDEEKVQLQAATVLMKFWMTGIRHRRPTPSAGAGEQDAVDLLHQMVGNVTDEQFAQTARNFLAEYETKPTDEPRDDGDPLGGGRPKITPPPRPPHPSAAPVHDTNDGTTKTYDPDPWPNRDFDGGPSACGRSNPQRRPLRGDERQVGGDVADGHLNHALQRQRPLLAVLAGAGEVGRRQLLKDAGHRGSRGVDQGQFLGRVAVVVVQRLREKILVGRQHLRIVGREDAIHAFDQDRLEVGQVGDHFQRAPLAGHVGYACNPLGTELARSRGAR